MYKPRPPHPRYKGRNGFTEFNATLANSRSETDMAEAQDLAQLLLDEMGSSIPSLAKMTAINDTPETLASVKERIAMLTAEYHSEWTKLLDILSREIGANALDRYFQTDDLFYVGEHANDGDYVRLRDRIESMYKLESSIHETRCSDLLERFQYEHLLELIALHKRRIELERIEEMARINKEAMFPTSATEYRNMTSRAAQLRVARYLMADLNVQERLRNSLKWTVEDTQGLMHEYNTNTTFQAEVKKFVLENASRDPRHRNN